MTVDYAATEQLDLQATLSFSDAQAEWKGLSISYPGIVNDPVLLELYDPEGMTTITDYSTLHYQLTDISLGGTYRFTPALYMTAQASWEYYNDKDAYVYGDMSGEAYRGYLGLGYSF